jgi:hypothetical protein
MMRGFDTCATPSLPTMRKWHQVFSAIAIYIGGRRRAAGAGICRPPGYVPRRPWAGH